MPHVTVQMLAGRTSQQKKDLIEEVTKAVCDSCRVPTEAVSVVIQELPRENWGRAGLPMSERS